MSGALAPRAVLLAAALLSVGAAGCVRVGDTLGDPANPRVLLSTSHGNLTLELFPRLAPGTVQNFLDHVEAGFYDGLIFHRVIQGFVVQGGGVDVNGTEKQPPFDPIPLEVHPELTHRDGCVAMARTEEPDSATSQFYLCDGPQHRLDDAVRMQERGERGYAVFGRVTDGLPVLRTIAVVPTDSDDRPVRNVVLRNAMLLE